MPNKPSSPLYESHDFEEVETAFDRRLRGETAPAPVDYTDDSTYALALQDALGTTAESSEPKFPVLESYVDGPDTNADSLTARMMTPFSHEERRDLFFESPDLPPDQLDESILHHMMGTGYGHLIESYASDVAGVAALYPDLIDIPTATLALYGPHTGCPPMIQKHIAKTYPNTKKFISNAGAMDQDSTAIMAEYSRRYRINHIDALLNQIFLRNPELENSRRVKTLFAKRFADNNLSQSHRNAQTHVYTTHAATMRKLAPRFHADLHNRGLNMSTRPLATFNSKAQKRLTKHLSHKPDHSMPFMRNYTLDASMLPVENRLEAESHSYSHYQLDSDYSMWQHMNASFVLHSPDTPLIYAIQPIQFGPFGLYNRSDRIGVPFMLGHETRLPFDQAMLYCSLPRYGTESVREAYRNHASDLALFTDLHVPFITFALWTQIIESVCETGRGSVRPFHLASPPNKTLMMLFEMYLNQTLRIYYN